MTFFKIINFSLQNYHMRNYKKKNPYFFIYQIMIKIYYQYHTTRQLNFKNILEYINILNNFFQNGQKK